MFDRTSSPPAEIETDEDVRDILEAAAAQELDDALLERAIRLVGDAA